ncbi:MAG: hypothetical protein AB7G93_03655 [Bdellovibrionales bacterium]
MKFSGLSLTLTTLIGVLISAVAGAESFTCKGTGRFSGVTGEIFKLEWPRRPEQPVFTSPGLAIKILLDKSIAEGPEFLGIDVTEVKPNGEIENKGAYGSDRDVVIYKASSTDVVSCAPVSKGGLPPTSICAVDPQLPQCQDQTTRKRPARVKNVCDICPSCCL